MSICVNFCVLNTGISTAAKTKNHYDAFISYAANNKQDAAYKLDHPQDVLPTLIGLETIGLSYILGFNDYVGDSVFKGGISCIYGYIYIYKQTYYGTQFAISIGCAKPLFRRKTLDGWSTWVEI